MNNKGFFEDLINKGVERDCLDVMRRIYPLQRKRKTIKQKTEKAIPDNLFLFSEEKEEVGSLYNAV